MNFGKSLSVCIAKSDMKNKQVAKSLNISMQSLATWKKLEHTNSQNIQKCADLFNMSICEFIEQGKENEH